MSRSLNEKVYEGVLEQIKFYIEANKLTPGDKLPSERELSERLKVGRSSIREALRAMELLGLIETRRGEGTFMRAYRPYHMVELLSKFLLNESRTREELLTAKQMLEKEVLLLSVGRLSNDQLACMSEILQGEHSCDRHQRLFCYLFEQCNHPLLLSMWQFIVGFTHTAHDITYQDDWYKQMEAIVGNGSPEQLLALFDFE
ncbi:GntR family transcriptional regulator [Halobacillus shinanisalinarum]|uniref:GntR family transcriptional regulator n=1 Tax=Halobacillus shinanisalinarum TaxID=2932258 RepID=A0ABY4H101_9BACI|nr:GntR family transcriptional regulator [Halobacillus shinanisalinarum]UOQ94121.1 GntR family transcriptional regulator [Halobacillus shinanisalinarum]